MQKPLILFAQWFGPWPQWFEFFVESCKWNADIDWLIFTDQDPPENRAPNVRYRKLGFADQKALISQAIGLDLAHVTPLKLCDLKPTLGHVFSADTEGYSNYGHCDVDLIFGDIRSFYTDALLEEYEVLSTHDDRISGHLVVLRNNEFNKHAFRRIKGWRRKVMDAHTHSIDEYRFGNVFVRPSLFRRLTERRVPTLFEERYTTPLTRRPWLDGTQNYPTRWYWRAGKITAEGYEDREFIYIHFMNWKSSTSHTVRGGYSSAPWSKLPRIVSIDWRKAGSEGFMISHDGIGPLPQRTAGDTQPEFAPAVQG
jgi:hypothetical protein